VKLNLYLAVVLIFFPTIMKAQNYDSLLNEIRIQQDTNQVLTMIALGKKLRRVDVDSSLNILEAANRRASLIGFPKGQIAALVARGITYGMNNIYPESILSFTEAASLGEMYNYPSHTADAYNGLGIVYKRIGDYPTSYTYYNNALEIYKSNNLVKGQATAYENLGILHDLMGDLEESFDYYKRAIHIRDSLGQESMKYNIMGNLALYYYSKKKYREGVDIILQNLKYFEENDDIYSLTNARNNLSSLYQLMGKYDSAIYYATEVIENANMTSLAQVVAASYLNRSKAYLKIGELQKAHKDALACQEMSQGLGFVKHLESAELLVMVYEALGDTDKALEACRKVVQYKDSLFEKNKVSQFKAEQVKQKVFDKNQQIQQQQANMHTMELKIEKDRELRIFLVVISVLLLVTIVLVYQKYTFKNRVNKVLEKKNHLISNQKSEIEVINKELENRMLRAQINPHFIFNALSSIQHFITGNDKKSALVYLTKFSSLLRQILENSINVKVPIADEIKFLKIYLDLESLRFSGSFSYDINVDPAVNIDDQEVPILLLQPFVENAILHGLLPKEGEKELRIEVKEDGDYIIYAIEDNGIGRKAASALKDKKQTNPSRGLSVTQQRIDLLKKGSKSGQVVFEDLTAENGESAGTRVIIKVPKI